MLGKARLSPNTKNGSHIKQRGSIRIRQEFLAPSTGRKRFPFSDMLMRIQATTIATASQLVTMQEPSFT
jgi:hypothetical protein